MKCEYGTTACAGVGKDHRCFEGQPLEVKHAVNKEYAFAIDNLVGHLQSVRTLSDWDRSIVSLAAATLQKYYTELVERRCDMAALQEIVDGWQGER